MSLYFSPENIKREAKESSVFENIRKWIRENTLDIEDVITIFYIILKNY